MPSSWPTIFRMSARLMIKPLELRLNRRPRLCIRGFLILKFKTRTAVSFILSFLAFNVFPFQPASAQNIFQTGAAIIGRIHYQGGGDWYNDPSIIPNVSRFIRIHTRIDLEEREIQIRLDDPELFTCPILFLTGHGNIHFAENEVRGLRQYLLGGGFLFADDDYGMDAAFRREMKKVFPDRDWIELPFSHGIYHCVFDFNHGLPKIHEHDNKPPQGFALMNDGQRMMVFYSYESNISDGWADPDVHQDPPEKREEALKMGANIVVWALTN
jgi:hypothetical protein